MEVKRRECEREAKETEHEEDSIHTIVFAVGTVLLMVCIKRFLVEQWRAWVFLILNLILLAILFMSMRPDCWVVRSSESEGSVDEVKNDKIKRRKPCGCSQEIEEEEEEKECSNEQYCWTSTRVHVQNERDEEEEEEEEIEEVGVVEELPRLSKEELNERVEAFIAMFRQHLVSDVKQAENLRFRKTANLTPKKLQVPCC